MGGEAGALQKPLEPHPRQLFRLRRARAEWGRAMRATHSTRDTAILRIEDLAESISAALKRRDTPPVLRRYIRQGLSEVFNSLENNDAVTDTPSYIRLLLTRRYEEQKGGTP